MKTTLGRRALHRVAPPWNSGGFTLVEIMISLAISAFLIGGVLLMQQSSRVASLESENWSRAQESLRFVGEYLVREARNAGFRDQLSLSIDEFNAVGSEFAAILSDADGNESLVVRHAGLAHCEDPLDSVIDLTNFQASAQLVTNRYFVDTATGEFRCAGAFGFTPNDGAGVGLARGVQQIDFEFVCPDGTTACSCTLWEQGADRCSQESIVDQTCQGVQTTLTMQPIGAGADAVAIPIELTSTFRNVLLDRLKWDSVDDSGSSCP